MVRAPIGNARRRGIRAPETMSTTDCGDAGNCTVARPAAPQLFNAAADRPLPLHGAERRQPGVFRQPDGQISRGCQRGRHDPLCHPRVLAVPRNRGSRLLFRKNSAPRRGFERIESGGSAAEAAFGANRGPAARPARNSRRVLIYFSYPLPNRLLKQTSWPRMNTDEHGFEECKCFVFNPRSSAFHFGHHNHVSIENIGVTLRGPAPVF